MSVRFDVGQLMALFLWAARVPEPTQTVHCSLLFEANVSEYYPSQLVKKNPVILAADG